MFHLEIDNNRHFLLALVISLLLHLSLTIGFGNSAFNKAREQYIEVYLKPIIVKKGTQSTLQHKRSNKSNKRKEKKVVNKKKDTERGDNKQISIISTTKVESAQPYPAFLEELRDKILTNFKLPFFLQFKNSLREEVLVQIRIDAAGNVIGIKFVKDSKYRAINRAIVKAITESFPIEYRTKITSSIVVEIPLIIKSS